MDPHDILGLQADASEDEIVEKYKMLLEEYTLTNTEENKEKIKLLNQAYDLLINGNLYKEVRSLIQKNNFPSAEAKLNLANDRNNAEWNYLQGFVCVQKGWFESGLNYLRKAVELDPENKEYISGLNTLQSRIINYATKYANQSNNKGQASNNMNACGGGGSNNGGMC